MHESMDTGDDVDSSCQQTAANPMTGAEGAAAEVIRECVGTDAMAIEDGRLTGIEFKELPDLKELPGLSSLVALKTLEISACDGLMALPELISLVALTTLDIKYCPRLTELPELSSLAALTTLRISVCEGLTALPELSSLVALTTLKISACDRLTALPELSSLVSLTTLMISECTVLTALPELSSLVSLTTLKISACDRLTALPELSSLSSLTTLKISSCDRLSALPELSSLAVLTTFSIDYCEGLTALPDLSSLVALTTLTISHCKGLKALPELSSLVALTTLDVSGCKTIFLGSSDIVRELPELSSLVALTTLKISSFDGLTALPELSSLVALTTLSIGYCEGLMALPDLSSLVALTTLTISHCKGLKALPELSSLVALTTLEIMFCDGLIALPELSSLEALTTLDISRCANVTALSITINVATILRLTELKAILRGSNHSFQGCGRSFFFLHVIMDPTCAEHLGHAVSADPSLAYLVSNLPATKGEHAIDLAVPECRRAMQNALYLLDRFAIDQGPPLHVSATAAVVAATDHHDQFANPLTRRALKLICEADQVCAELVGRIGLDAKYVVPVTAVYVDASVKEEDCEKVESVATKLGLTLERVNGLTDRLWRELAQRSGNRAMWMGQLASALPTDGEMPAKKRRSPALSVAQYTFLLVLYLADRTLSTALTHDHIAGHDFFAVRKIAHDLALALDHLHNHQSENRRIHADVKPLNAVRVNSTWTLIDFDVSCKLGQAFGAKVPSSGCCPPEMARVLLKAADGTAELSEYLASVAYDLWSYGVLLFHLITGRSLFHTNQDDSVSSTDLHELSTWSPVSLNKRLTDAAQVHGGEVKLAISLLRKLLESDPERRLSHFHAGQEMRSVLQDPWFGQQLPDAVEPRSLLIVACSPTISPLKHARSEADEVAGLCSGVVEVKHGGTANELRILLERPTRRWLFAGHADASSPGADTSLPKTLGFTLPDGGLELVRPEDLATIMRLATPSHGGCLELVVLNGCCSEPLGRAAHNAGVPSVVCWKTQAEDSAARIFTLALFTALENGRSTADAFDDAKTAVMCVTRKGKIAGLNTMIPKYELRGRGTPTAMTSVYPTPWPAGIPVLIE